MPHVVTQACCGDASCVYACPVNCIHPTPDEPDFGTAEMLYIDPNTCVDCGACVTACPVGAISASHHLTDGQERFIDINAAMYATTGAGQVGTADLGITPARFPVDPGRRAPLARIRPPEPIQVAERISVAVVGTGPSAMYAADELLRHEQVSVTMYERLDRPFGLARFGVAPDHHETRAVMALFDDIARNPRLDIRLNTEIGRDVQLSDLQRDHTAVIWAGGAPTDRPLAVEGAGATGVHSATSMVGWYNYHPDFADLDINLDVAEAVVIGNGNVALDVARILVRDRDHLAATTIAPQALAALRSSPIERVTVLGRRGAEHAAFTLPELVGLVDGGIPVTTDASELPDPAAATSPTAAKKLELLHELAARPTPAGRHIRFVFNRVPQRLVVEDNRVREVVVDNLGSAQVLDAGLVLTAIGYRGRPVPGLPFDESRGVVPHHQGRVIDSDGPVRGMYVTGWIKRGPSGFIGTNKTDSTETVTSLLADLDAGLIAPLQRSSSPTGWRRVMSPALFR